MLGCVALGLWSASDRPTFLKDRGGGMEAQDLQTSGEFGVQAKSIHLLFLWQRFSFNLSTSTYVQNGIWFWGEKRL